MMEILGDLEITPKLSIDVAMYINTLAKSRRMKMDVSSIYGEDGEYYVHGNFNGANTKDSNSPPGFQPGLWCQFVINEDGNIVWDGGEKFYNPVEWLIYLMEHFLLPHGYSVNGVMNCNYLDYDEHDSIAVRDNEIYYFTNQTIKVIDDDVVIAVGLLNGSCKLYNLKPIKEKLDFTELIKK